MPITELAKLARAEVPRHPVVRAPSPCHHVFLQIVSAHSSASSLPAAPRAARASGDGDGAGSDAEGGDAEAGEEAKGGIPAPAAKRRRV